MSWQERSCVIWNPQASSAGSNEVLLARLEANSDVYRTSSEEHARELAEQAIDQQLKTVVVAGGDGTVHQVVKALLERWQSARDLPRLAILPLGTGNDLCRSLNIPLDPDLALEVLEAEREVAIDVLRIATPDTTSWCVNVASTGNSTRVSEMLDPEMKVRWGPWAYLRGAVPVLTDLHSFPITIQLDDDPDEHFLAWNVIVANGRFVAGGIAVAPSAVMNDGEFDVVVVLDGTPFDATRLAMGLLAGDYLDDERVWHRRARRLSLQLNGCLPIIIDGERLDASELYCEIHPKLLRVIVGSEIPELGSRREPLF
jgi:diacylglycerol kinase (ATP)